MPAQADIDTHFCSTGTWKVTWMPSSPTACHTQTCWHLIKKNSPTEKTCFCEAQSVLRAPANTDSELAALGKGRCNWSSTLAFEGGHGLRILLYLGLNDVTASQHATKALDIQHIELRIIGQHNGHMYVHKSYALHCILWHEMTWHCT